MESTKSIVGFDMETSSNDPLTCDIASIQIYEDGESKFFPINMVDMEPIDPVPILEQIADQYRIIGHRLYFDLMIAKRYGVEIEPAADSFLLFCQTPEAVNYPKESRSLKDLAGLMGLGKNLPRFYEICPSLNFCNVSIHDGDAIKYAKDDAYYSFKIAHMMGEKYPYLLEAHVEEMEVLPLFIDMTLKGLRVDHAKLETLQSDLEQELARVKQWLVEKTGIDFSHNSAKELVPVFEAIDLVPPPIPEGKNYPSITKAVLESYLPNPVIEKIIEARSLSFALPRVNTVLLDHVKGNKIHPYYNQIGWTGSGRVYTQGPATNSLTMPARKCIIPKQGHYFAYGDWKAAEFAACFQEAGEQKLIDAYFSGKHPIVSAAAETFGIDEDEVSKDQKEVQKVITYAILYGSDGVSIVNALGCSQSDAKKKVEDFWEKFPAIKQFRQQVIDEARNDGYVTTWTGFVRHLLNIDSDNTAIREKAERKAFNTRFQTGIACLFKRALLKLKKTLPPGVRVATGVYDSFLLEVPDHISLSELEPILKEASTFDLNGKKVRFRIDLNRGDNWAEAQEGDEI